MQKWTCPVSEEWDRYLLQAEFEGRPQLENHLRECPQCRFYVQQRVRELEELGNTWGRLPSDGVIELTCFSEAEGHDDTGATLLAAKGDSEPPHTEAVALASPDRKVLMRAVRDHHTREVWLYILSEDPSLLKDALVKPFRQDREYLADDQGRINLGNIEWPSASELKAEIRLPKASFKLDHYDPQRDIENVVELKSARGDRINITITGEGQNCRLGIEVVEIQGLRAESMFKVAVRESGRLNILDIKDVIDRTAAFDNINIPERLEIYLYY